MSDPAQGTERPKLSAGFREYLIALSVALQRHAMYPDGHPSLEPAVDAVIRRASHLLADQPSLAFGVARRQLVVDGVMTDAGHPVLGRLAEQLHRHRLAAVTVTRGLEASELQHVLRRLASEPTKVDSGPTSPGGMNEWSHVILQPQAFDTLAMAGDVLDVDEQDGATLSAELWTSLARVALYGNVDPTDDDVPLEPAAVAGAIDRSVGTPASEELIGGYLAQIVRQLRTSSGAGTALLRQRASRMIRELRPQSLRRIVAMGGDGGQQAALVLDAVQTLEPDAAIDLVKAAAGANRQSISHSLVRLLSKLALHADGAPDHLSPMAHEALREQVGRLLAEWHLDDPNPEWHTRTLQYLATDGHSGDGGGAVNALEAAEGLRIVQMSLESGISGPFLDRAVDACVAVGRTADVVALLSSQPSDAAPVAEAVRSRLLAPASLAVLLASDPLDVDSLDRLLPSMTLAGYDVLLDTLSSSANRATRRRLLDRLATAPVDLGPAIRDRLHDDRWYVQRNMLVLLERTGRVPEGVSIEDWTSHADPRVRLDAIRLQLAMPASRPAAIRAALSDDDARIVRTGLGALGGECPPEMVERLGHLARASAVGSDLRLMAIGLLSGSREPLALSVLLQLADGGRTWYGRRRLAARSPVLTAAIRALAQGWRTDVRAAAMLALAARSENAELMEAARPT